MTKPIPNYLKIHTEEPASTVRPDVEEFRSLPALCIAFERATGWPLHYVPGEPSSSDPMLMWSAPVNPGVGESPGHVRIESIESDPSADEPRINLDLAGALATAVAGVLGDLTHARHVLWQREAELAAGVPVAPHHDEPEHLAARLEAALRGGAELLGCQAAGLYLLDVDTTELKLRSCWGLAADRLTEPARALRGATADLEALLGHVVTLGDTQLFEGWNVPEPFAAAICAPVSSPTVPLGTIWFFGERKRDFTDRDANLAEIVAGRISADLEREMLLTEGLDGARVKRQLALAERKQHDALPHLAPLLDGWQLRGWTQAAGALCGDFFDWFLLPDDRLALAVGDAMCVGQPVAGAMAAAGLRTAVRAHGPRESSADAVLEAVNETIWQSSPGDDAASLTYVSIDTASGKFSMAAAGTSGALLLCGDGCESLIERQPLAGADPDTRFCEIENVIVPGACLVLYSDGLRDAHDAAGLPLGERALAEALLPHLDESAEQLADRVRQWFDAHAASPDDDRTVIIARREPRC